MRAHVVEVAEKDFEASLLRALIRLWMLADPILERSVHPFVNAILLHPFSAYRDPDRLVMVWATHPQKGLTRQRASYPEFQDWVAQNDIFDYPVAFAEGMVNLSGAGDPEMVQVYVTSPGLFRLLGVEAARGRTFLPEEEVATGQTLNNNISAGERFEARFPPALRYRRKNHRWCFC